MYLKAFAVAPQAPDPAAGVGKQKRRRKDGLTQKAAGAARVEPPHCGTYRKDRTMADQDNQTKPDTTAALPLKADTGHMPPTALRPAEVARPAHDLQAVSRPSNLSSPEGKKLIVGREIQLSGNISACDKLVVEGRVEAELQDCRQIEIASTGTFKGSAAIDMAEISGNFEGTLTARDILIVRSTGRITGTVRFGKLEIERGGEVVGDIGLCDPAGDA
jgi:cytoskeletal protein CcmA (bactofilin family)